MKKSIYKGIIGSVIGLTGFILSPLTWWNDMLVNLPLAFGFAWITGKALSFAIDVNIYVFLTLVSIGYFLTNVVGFMLMHKGIAICQNKKGYKFSWKKNCLYALLAFAIVVLTIQVGLLNLDETKQLMASVLRVSYLK